MDDALAFLNDGRGRPEFRRQRLKICEAFIAQQKSKENNISDRGKDPAKSSLSLFP